jgi:hypothetical protein
MKSDNNGNGGLIYFMSFVIVINIIAGGMSSRERDNIIKEKIDSISVKIDSIQTQLNNLYHNE